MSRQPLVVELIGPAGAGKSTLAQALVRETAGFVLGNAPSVRSAGSIPFFVANCLAELPVLLSLARGGSLPTRRQVAWMATLRGWPSRLRSQAPGGATAIVLDQGPVYLLAELLAFGPRGLVNPGTAVWWTEMSETWARTLDLIVWLDADDATLIPRIRGRRKAHALKTQTERDAARLLARYRQAYAQVVAALTGSGRGPAVLQFDTGSTSPEEVVGATLDALAVRGAPVPARAVDLEGGGAAC